MVFLCSLQKGLCSFPYLTMSDMVLEDVTELYVLADFLNFLHY